MGRDKSLGPGCVLETRYAKANPVQSGSVDAQAYLSAVGRQYLSTPFLKYMDAIRRATSS